MANFARLAAEIGSGVWGTPANFVLPSLLQRRRSLEAKKTLYDAWRSPGLVHYVYIWGLLPLMEFCQVQNALYVQVLRSPILVPVALLHGTPAAASGKFAA